MSKLCTWFAQSLGVVLVYTSIRLTQTMYSKKHAPLSHVNLQFAQYPLLQTAYYWLSVFDTALKRPTFALVESKVFCPQLNASQQNRRESRSQNQDFVVGFCPFPTPRLWPLPSGVDMWVSHWNIFFIIPVSMTYTGAIIILRWSTSRIIWFF